MCIGESPGRADRLCTGAGSREGTARASGQTAGASSCLVVVFAVAPGADQCSRHAAECVNLFLGLTGSRGGNDPGSGVVPGVDFKSRTRIFAPAGFVRAMAFFWHRPLDPDLAEPPFEIRSTNKARGTPARVLCRRKPPSVLLESIYLARTRLS